MGKLIIETWTSNEGSREDHYFLGDAKTYVFGYNPKLVTEEKAERILKIILEE